MNKLTHRLCTIAGAIVSIVPLAHAGPVLFANVIVNGGAESYTFPDPMSSVTDFQGWTRTGDTYANTYALFPMNFVNPGAEQFGLAYFIGGDGDTSSLTQTVSVSSVAALIDAGSVAYDLRGWLGTFRQGSTTAPQDSSVVSVRFLDGLGQDLGGTGFNSPDQGELTSIGALLNQYYSVLRTADGVLPVGTRSIDVSLLFTRQQGFISNGSVDNLSLELTSTVPEPSTMMLMAVGCAALFRMRRGPGLPVPRTPTGSELRR